MFRADPGERGSRTDSAMNKVAQAPKYFSNFAGLPGASRIHRALCAISSWVPVMITAGSILLVSIAAQTRSAFASTLYLAYLRPESPAVTPGSGSATLRLSDDQRSAIVSFEYSNLTSAITGVHIHGPADPGEKAPILFDLDTAARRADGTYLWVFTPTDLNSVANIANAIGTARIYFNIHTENFPAGEIDGPFVLANASRAAPVPTPPPPLASGTPTAQDAARFLSQATFGATDALISRVQRRGFDAFLAEQFAAPKSSYLAFIDGSTPTLFPFQETRTAWWTYAVFGPDQLRQRIAFALSEFFVVSKTPGSLGNFPDALPAYMDVLVKDAFGNYRQLLRDITLNPAMGQYLDMLLNDKADPATGRQPNENYAREIMQLFSIGLYQLNRDGSLTLGSDGLPISTYTQTDVEGLAAALTGWTWAQPGAPIFSNKATPDWRHPMVNVASHHSSDVKHILGGFVIPAGQTADEDLQMALDTIFNHPNVGPFFCKALIQRLVTSNPSSGYVYRVASAFNDNGQGVRGDLKAVVRAILLDYDARSLASTDQGAGHLREPVVRVTNLLRAFNASTSTGTFSVPLAMYTFGEEPMNAPSVFNFFSPDYQVPGPIAQLGLKSPEFQITTETNAVKTANYLTSVIFGNKVTLNLSYDEMLAADPPRLVDHLNSLLMAGNMSQQMRSTLINIIAQIPDNNATGRVKMAIDLVVNSPEFVIDK